MISVPTESNALQAMRSFLLEVLPASVEVITSQSNRVPEPKSPVFVVMTPIRFRRLRTNVDSDADVRFTGSIAGTTLTVTDIDFGEIVLGATVFGVGVAAGTRVLALGTGTGGVGTYTVSVAQTVASGVLAAGAKSLEQGIEHTIQLDFHSDDLSSANLANVVSTTLRDAYGVDQFANQNPNYGVVPLYADDARATPFLNEAQQYEWRWVVEALLQVNAVVSVPQQYADSATVDAISVDVAFPP